MADRQGADGLASAPTFTPYTVKPDIKNRADVARALGENYPPLLRDAGIGGTVQIWFYVDETGEVKRLQIDESSGHKALDDAALRVGSVIEFTPALNRDKAVPVWLSLPVTFTIQGAGEASGERPKEAPEAGDAKRVRIVIPPKPEELRRNDLPKPAPETTYPLSDAPTFTPYTVQPDITNRSEVARALEENYPPLLRDAGIGGTVQVWFFVDEEGVVQNAQMAKTSGEEALDDAALRVAEMIRFTPALNRDKAVPVWISLPITFTTR
jgi:TonB family protein